MIEPTPSVGRLAIQPPKSYCKRRPVARSTYMEATARLDLQPGIRWKKARIARLTQSRRVLNLLQRLVSMGILAPVAVTHTRQMCGAGASSSASSLVALTPSKASPFKKLLTTSLASRLTGHETWTALAVRCSKQFSRETQPLGPRFKAWSVQASSKDSTGTTSSQASSRFVIRPEILYRRSKQSSRSRGQSLIGSLCAMMIVNHRVSHKWDVNRLIRTTIDEISWRRSSSKPFMMRSPIFDPNNSLRANHTATSTTSNQLGWVQRS